MGIEVGHGQTWMRARFGLDFVVLVAWKRRLLISSAFELMTSSLARESALTCEEIHLLSRTLTR